MVKKTAYLNVPFVLFRTIICAGLWIFMVRDIRKRSVESDLTNDFLPLHFKNIARAGIFIVFFEVLTNFKVIGNLPMNFSHRFVAH